MLTLLGGKPVHGDAEFKELAPPLPKPMPDWSPVGHYGGYQDRARRRAATGQAFAEHDHSTHAACGVHAHARARVWGGDVPVSDERAFWGALGCSCWAF